MLILGPSHRPKRLCRPQESRSSTRTKQKQTESHQSQNLASKALQAQAQCTPQCQPRNWTWSLQQAQLQCTPQCRPGNWTWSLQQAQLLCLWKRKRQPNGAAHGRCMRPPRDTTRVGSRATGGDGEAGTAGTAGQAPGIGRMHGSHQQSPQALRKQQKAPAPPVMRPHVEKMCGQPSAAPAHLQKSWRQSQKKPRNSRQHSRKQSMTLSETTS